MLICRILSKFVPKNNFYSIMFKKILPIFMVCAIALCMASCLEDDEQEIIYYEDTAVTSFSLGNLNKYVTVKSSTGEDSIVKLTTDCRSYGFRIDNMSRPCMIYNPDSLPLGIDPSKVLCTVNTKNSGVAVWKYTDANGKDSLAFYSAQDSVDLSEPRELRVYNTMLTAYRAYTVTLNVHKEVADSFVWKSFGADATLSSLKAMRSVCAGGSVYLFGFDGASTRLYMGDVTSFAGFGQTDVVLGADAYSNVAMLDGEVYVLDGTELKTVTGGVVSVISGNADISRLVGAGGTRLYAYDANGLMVSSIDGGSTWKACGMDAPASLLPVDNINMVALKSKTNDDTYQVMMVGNGTDTSKTSIWSKVEEAPGAEEDQPWSIFSLGEDNHYLLPALAALHVIPYNNGALAIGGKALDGSPSKPFSQFYASKDGGLTWHADSTYTLPEDFSSVSDCFTMAVDSNNFIWLVCGGTGQVWRGRLNALGWATDDKKIIAE